jgi:hypothetical protein
LPVRPPEPRKPVPPIPEEGELATTDGQLDLLVSDEELMRRRALDELECVNHPISGY